MRPCGERPDENRAACALRTASSALARVWPGVWMSLFQGPVCSRADPRKAGDSREGGTECQPGRGREASAGCPASAPDRPPVPPHSPPAGPPWDPRAPKPPDPAGRSPPCTIGPINVLFKVVRRHWTPIASKCCRSALESGVPLQWAPGSGQRPRRERPPRRRAQAAPPHAGPAAAGQRRRWAGPSALMLD